MIPLFLPRIWKNGGKSLMLRVFSTVGTSIQKWNEIKIPVNWGEIAAKEWGPKDGFPVMAIHGWQDNACTFDALIPLLSPNLRIVAIDLLGHGLSSHKPKNSLYYNSERLIEVKQVADYLNWKQFTLLGHSFGGSISIVFSCVFPEMIQKLILIDAPYPSIQPIQNASINTKNSIEAYFEFEEKLHRRAPVYSPKAALDRFIKGHLNEITEKSAKILLQRASRDSDDGKGVVFTRDIRIQVPEAIFLTTELAVDYMRTLKCDTLLLKSKESAYQMFHDDEIVKTFISLFEKYCKSFRLEVVEGNHFFHLNHPELTAPIINSWLESQI